jgi:hypothetical protein
MQSIRCLYGNDGRLVTWVPESEGCRLGKQFRLASVFNWFDASTELTSTKSTRGGLYNERRVLPRPYSSQIKLRPQSEKRDGALREEGQQLASDGVNLWMGGHRAVEAPAVVIHSLRGDGSCIINGQRKGKATFHQAQDAPIMIYQARVAKLVIQIFDRLLKDPGTELCNDDDEKANYTPEIADLQSRGKE